MKSRFDLDELTSEPEEHSNLRAPALDTVPTPTNRRMGEPRVRIPLAQKLGVKKWRAHGGRQNSE